MGILTEDWMKKIVSKKQHNDGRDIINKNFFFVFCKIISNWYIYIYIYIDYYGNEILRRHIYMRRVAGWVQILIDSVSFEEIEKKRTVLKIGKAIDREYVIISQIGK